MTKDNKSECIGNRLRIAREQAGLSQGQVAKIMELHRPSITEAEAGRRKISAEELTEFAQIYGVSMEWLACADTQEHDERRDRIEIAARGLSKMKKEDLDLLLDLLVTLRQDNDQS